MESRRSFLKKALYVAPLVLSVGVKPAYACSAYRRPAGGGGATLKVRPSGHGARGGRGGRRGQRPPRRFLSR